MVSEESGTGLGARCAGTIHVDPGPEIGVGPPTVRVRIGSQSVPLWAVSTASRATTASSTARWSPARPDGRWLWVVLRPASAMLLLRDEWILRDVSGIGPPLVEMPFGGPVADLVTGSGVARQRAVSLPGWAASSTRTLFTRRS